MVESGVQELMQFLQLHANEIHVREEINGKWGNYTLAELPGNKAMMHMAQFIEEGRRPLILKAEDIQVQARLTQLEDLVAGALQLAADFAQSEGSDHRLWVIDQMILKLLGEETYRRWIASYENCPDCVGRGVIDGDRCPACDGSGKPYQWDRGSAP